METNDLNQALLVLLPTVFDIGIGSIAILASRISSRLKRHQIKPLALGLASFASIVVVGIGFVIQPVFDEIFGQTANIFGHVYDIEFLTVSLVCNELFNMLAHGFMPGILLAVAFLHRTKYPTILYAAVAGAAVLIFTDLAHYTIALMLAPEHKAEFTTNLLFSILCNIVGGPIAGVVCRWISIEIVEHTSQRQPIALLIRSGGNIVLFVITLITASTIFYMVFVRPTSSETILTLKQRVVVRYQADVDKKYFKAKPGSLDEKLRNARSWQIPMLGTSVVGFGVKPYNMTMTGHGEGGAISAQIIGVQGCDTPEAAISAAEKGGQLGERVNVDGTEISLVGSIQTLSLHTKEPDKHELTLIVPNANTISSVVTKDKSERRIGFGGIANLNIPLAKDTILVFSAMPDWLALPDNQREFPSHVGDAGNTALLLKKDGQTKSYLVPRGAPNPNDCAAVKFLADSSQEPDMQAPLSFSPNYIVMQVTDSAADARVLVDLTFFVMSVPPGEIQLSTSRGTGKADYFKATALEGTLSIGTQRYELEPNDSVLLAGDPVDISEDEDGVIVVQGMSRYVLLNSSRLNTTLWGSLSGEIQSLLVLAFTTALGLLFRKHIGQLAARVFRGS